jgi:hypothetical protein
LHFFQCFLSTTYFGDIFWTCILVYQRIWNTVLLDTPYWVFGHINTFVQTLELNAYMVKNRTLSNIWQKVKNVLQISMNLSLNPRKFWKLIVPAVQCTLNRFLL